MNTNGRARNQEPNVAASFSELTHDAIELAELQAKLFALDMKCTTQRTRTSLILLVNGVCLLLGTMPVALITVAQFCMQNLEWTPVGAYAMATLVGIVLSGSILGAAWMRFQSGMHVLERSREELGRNIAWVKASLRSGALANSGESESREPERTSYPR